MTSQLSDFAANQPKPGLPDFDHTDRAMAETIDRLEAENKRLRTRVEEAETGWRETLLLRGKEHREHREAEQRPDHAVLVSIATLAEEQVTQLKHVVKALQTAAESRNVVEIDSNGSAGHIKVKVRCVGETLEDAHATALEQFAQAMAEVEAGSVNGWAATVEMLAAKKGAAA